MPLFWLQKWLELGHVSQVAKFWLPSHKFGEVTVIKKIHYFQNYNGVLYGAATSPNMAAPYKTLLNQ